MIEIEKPRIETIEISVTSVLIQTAHPTQILFKYSTILQFYPVLINQPVQLATPFLLLGTSILSRLVDQLNLPVYLNLVDRMSYRVECRLRHDA